jgi:chemotaxis protein methyltransferase CheR
VTTPLAYLAWLIHRETGITIAEGDSTLRSALRRAAPDLDPATFLLALSDPATGQRLKDRLIDEVTVSETSFLRDRDQLDAIAWREIFQRVLAESAERPAVIRVWVTACSTGEEPYTLAMLAAEAFGTGRPPVEVLGTDISAAALAAATAGRYAERAVRTLSEPLRQRYLERQPDGSYLVEPRLREVVRFRRHNLVNDPAPPPGETGFDIITCRNVLIYFDTPDAERVLGLLRGSLRPGGRLLVGAADSLNRALRIQPADGPARGPDAPRRRPRKPVGRRPPTRRERVSAALAAAGAGDRDGALSLLTPLLIADPLDADAQFGYGLILLEEGSADKAVAAFRRALYADPSFAIAAFTLGCAHDALGDAVAARRAYGQALRTLNPDDDRHDVVLQQVDIGDIAAACRARLNAHGERP